jgi:hypothetical protein
LNLRELELFGRRFTWANSIANPTYEKLNIIIMPTEWEQKFPLSNVLALSHVISDHTPLFLDTGHNTSMNSQHLFKFELGWLIRDGFIDIVKEIWDSVNDLDDKLKSWQSKIRRLRQHLRGWTKNVSGTNKKEKKEFLDKLDMLDKRAEGDRFKTMFA